MKPDYGSYEVLKLNRPADRILEVVIDNPGRLNSLDARGHKEMAEIWRDIDVDQDVSCVLLRGEGGNFSAGGDLDLIDDMTNSWGRAGARVARGARYCLQRHQLLEAGRRGD